jgi:hypothetical protein
VVWKKSDWLNALIKVALFLMAVWAGFYVYSAALETPANPIEEVVDATRQD